jgi:hypothetical protein
MKTTIAITCSLVLLVGFTLAAEAPKHSYKPAGGYVPDAKTAIRIAVAVWEPIYGEKQIGKQKPYQATLTNGVWTVEGTFHGSGFGGVAVAEISKDDARVLRVSHGK